MQNVVDTENENKPTAVTYKEHSDLHVEPPVTKLSTGAIVQPETKGKTRSRFSAALRSFSKSKSKSKSISSETTTTRTTSNKKESHSLPAEINTLTTEPTFASGIEESIKITASGGSTPAKKGTKLTRRFLLGSLKKTKVASKSKSFDGETTNEDVDRLAGSKDQEIKEQSSIAASASPKSAERPLTVQIRISGKKIEPIATRSSKHIGTVIDPKAEATLAGAATETDYLTPISATTKTTKTTTTTTLATKDSRTTKVIVSKVASAATAAKETITTPSKSSSTSLISRRGLPSLSTAKVAAAALAAKKKKAKSKKGSEATTTLPAIQATTNNSAETGEKIVITQSTRDTPPPERAPAKPSRVAALTASQQTLGSQTGAIRKTTTPQNQSVEALTTPKSQHSVAKKTLRTVATATTVISGRKQEKNFLQTTLQQRGHRSSRPKATTSTTTTTTATAQEKTTVENNQRSPIKVEQSEQYQSLPQQQIDIQLEPKTSGQPYPELHTLPLTPSDYELQLQSNEQSSKKELQPLAFPPQVILRNITSETRSPSENHYLQHSVKHAAYDSVETATLSEAEAISSAESAYARNNVQEAQREPSLTPVTVRFAVGSVVRPPHVSAYEATEVPTETLTSVGRENTSSDSHSESSCRRIRYTTSTLYGDHDSIRGRRETLHYQSVASEYLYDSEEAEAEAEEDDYESSDQPMPAFGDLTMDQEMEPTIMTSSNEKREHLYKILVIGELGTGKTSFIKRYVHQFFSQNYRATIGVDFALKVLHWDTNTIVRLQLWDIAGQERFGNMTRVYYKEAVGAFIVFDVTRSGTFDCVSKWKEDLDSKVQLPDGSPIPCILLANKCDQDKQGIVTTPEKMDEYVQENGFAGWFETSAKENINIDEAARALVHKILLNDKLISAADLGDNDKFNLNNTGDPTATVVKNKCAC